MSNNVIGLTGYYCSGKSTVEKILSEEFGYNIIDADKVGHEVLVEYQNVIVDALGQEILTDGKINRKILGKIVFSDKTKLDLLNRIVHPLIFEKIKEKISNSNENFVVSAALFFETHCDTLCQKTFVVKAPLLTIIRRGIKRDGHSICRIINILRSQKLKHYLKQNNVIVIKNNFAIVIFSTFSYKAL